MSNNSYVYKYDFNIAAGAPPVPMAGSFEYIYLRSASLDVLQVTGDGQNWSDLPIGLMFPLVGLMQSGRIGPRQPLIRAKGGVAVSGTVVCVVGQIQDFSLIIGTGTKLGVQGLDYLGSAKDLRLVNEGALTVTRAYGPAVYCIPEMTCFPSQSYNLQFAVGSATKRVCLKKFSWTYPPYASTTAGVSMLNFARVTGAPTARFATATAIKQRYDAPAATAVFNYCNAAGGIVGPSPITSQSELGAVSINMPASGFLGWTDPKNSVVDLTYGGLADGIWCDPGQYIGMYTGATQAPGSFGAFTAIWEEV